MYNYEKIFNGKSIYLYPFTKEVDYFTILWWTNINILSEDDFNILVSYFKEYNINKISILLRGEKVINNFDVNDFYFSKYKEIYIWKWDHDIFWNNYSGISLSEEYFALIWGNREFVKYFIDSLGEKKYRNRFKLFSDEWCSDKKWNWAYDLVNLPNFIDK